LVRRGVGVTLDKILEGVTVFININIAFRAPTGVIVELAGTSHSASLSSVHSTLKCQSLLGFASCTGRATRFDRTLDDRLVRSQKSVEHRGPIIDKLAESVVAVGHWLEEANDRSSGRSGLRDSSF
jgi:hypothetical protein